MIDFIVNPKAGKDGKKIRKALPKIEKRLHERNVSYVIHKTEMPNHATSLTRSLIKSGATTIVVIGGDGTLHEVINGFENFEKVALGIIPCGTGNDFASALNLPLDVVKALDLILDGEPKYTDFMQMPTVRGLNIIGMGIDVDVLTRYRALKRKTKFGYTSCLIKTLFKFDYVDFACSFDDIEQQEDYRSFIACVANGHRYGGGIPVCPIANATDKKLDFIAVKEIKRSKLIGAFLKLKKGKILSMKETTHKNMQKIKITPNKPYTVNVDGELYDNIPFEVEIVSDKLRVFRYIILFF